MIKLGIVCEIGIGCSHGLEPTTIGTAAAVLVAADTLINVLLGSAPAADPLALGILARGTVGTIGSLGRGIHFASELGKSSRYLYDVFGNCETRVS